MYPQFFKAIRRKESISMSNQEFISPANPIIGDLEVEAAARVIRSGNLAQGPEVAAFEEEFSKYIGIKHAIALNSGTSALHIALLSAGIKQGDDVIVPSFTFAATANVVKLVGANPIFIDIELDSYCINPDEIESAITPQTTAIIPVHLYGNPADMPRISEIAKKHNLKIIEDAAQAHGAAINDKQVGTWGAASAFSFYPTKNMTSGEGGMITTNDENIDRLARLYRNQGMAVRYLNELPGFNLRLTDILAAIGRVQLNKLESWTTERISNANYLTENLKGVHLPLVRPGFKHVFHQYTIRVDSNREEFVKELSKSGIGSGIYYPTPVHKLPSFALNFDLKQTEIASKSVISLPVWPTLGEEKLERIVKSVNKIARAGS